MREHGNRGAYEPPGSTAASDSTKWEEQGDGSAAAALSHKKSTAERAKKLFSRSSDNLDRKKAPEPKREAKLEARLSLSLRSVISGAGCEEDAERWSFSSRSSTIGVPAGVDNPPSMVLEENAPEVDGLDIKFECVAGPAHPIVVACTFEKLLERITDPNVEDRTLQKTALYTFSYFTTSRNWFESLVEIFYSATAITPHESDAGNSSAGSGSRATTQTKVIDVMLKWLERRFYYDDYDNIMATCDLVASIVDFCSSIETMSEDMGHAAVKLRECLTRNHYIGAHPAKVPGDNNSTIDEGIAATDIWTWQSDVDRVNDEHVAVAKAEDTRGRLRQIAEQMCLLDHRLLSAVRVNELLHGMWAKNPARAPNVTKMINRFNEVAMWVVEGVLSEVSEEARAAKIEGFITIAQYLLLFNNYYGLFQIIAGLRNSAVQRLRRTWERVGEQHMTVFQEYKELMCPPHHTGLRRLLKTLDSQAPAVPYLGMLLADLTFLHDGNDTFITSDQGIRFINIKKFMQITNLVQKFQNCQNHRYRFRTIKPLLQALANTRGNLTDDEAYNISQQLEPKDLKSSPPVLRQSSKKSSKESIQLTKPENPKEVFLPRDGGRRRSASLGQLHLLYDEAFNDAAQHDIAAILDPNAGRHKFRHAIDRVKQRVPGDNRTLHTDARGSACRGSISSMGSQDAIDPTRWPLSVPATPTADHPETFNLTIAEATPQNEVQIVPEVVPRQRARARTIATAFIHRKEKHSEVLSDTTQHPPSTADEEENSLARASNGSNRSLAHDDRRVKINDVWGASEVHYYPPTPPEPPAANAKMMRGSIHSASSDSGFEKTIHPRRKYGLYTAGKHMLRAVSLSTPVHSSLAPSSGGRTVLQSSQSMPDAPMAPTTRTNGLSFSFDEVQVKRGMNNGMKSASHDSLSKKAAVNEVERRMNDIDERKHKIHAAHLARKGALARSLSDSVLAHAFNRAQAAKPRGFTDWFSNMSMQSWLEDRATKNLSTSATLGNSINLCENSK